jgi:hypothetical protein
MLTAAKASYQPSIVQGNWGLLMGYAKVWNELTHLV